MIVDHTEWFLFAWVFCNQTGVPVPVVPALLGAGALAGSGHLNVAVMTGIAVGASLTADLTWYGLGRWRGAGVLKMLGPVAPNAGILVSRARPVFFAHVGAFQLAARFLPELNAIAAGPGRYDKGEHHALCVLRRRERLDMVRGWIGLGYILSHAVTETAAHLGIRPIVFFLAALALYLPFQRVRRHRLIHAFRQARISSDETLKAALENGARVSTPLLPLAHSSGKEDAQASQAVGAPFKGKSQGLDRMSDAPPDLINMVGRWPHP